MKFVTICILNVFLLSLLIAINCSAQDNSATINLYFDGKSDELCVIPQEQRGRYSGQIDTKRYKKEVQSSDEVHFYICNELFVSRKLSRTKMFGSEHLEKVKFSNIEELIDEVNKSNSLYPNKIYDKIYLYEQIDKNRVVKHKVSWEYYTE